MSSPIVVLTDEVVDEGWATLQQKCEVKFYVHSGFAGLFSRLRWALRVVFRPRKYGTVVALEFSQERTPKPNIHDNITALFGNGGAL